MNEQNDRIQEFLKDLENNIARAKEQNKLAYNMLKNLRIFDYFKNSCTSTMLTDMSDPIENEYSNDKYYVRTICNVMATIRGMGIVNEMREEELEQATGLFIETNAIKTKELMYDSKKIEDLEKINEILEHYFKDSEVGYYPTLVQSGAINERANREYYNALMDLQQRFTFDEFGITSKLINDSLFNPSEYNPTINYASELRSLYWNIEGVVQAINLHQYEYDNRKDKNEQLKHDLTTNKGAIVRIVEDRQLGATGLLQCNAEFPHNREINPAYVASYLRALNKEAQDSMKDTYKIIQYLDNKTLLDAFLNIRDKYGIDFTSSIPNEKSNDALNELIARLDGLAYTTKDIKTKRKYLIVKDLLNDKENTRDATIYSYNIDKEQSCYNKLRQWNEQYNVVHGGLLKDNFVVDTISYINTAQNWYYTLDTMIDRVEKGEYTLENVDMKIALNDLIDAQNGLLEICQEFDRLKDENYKNFEEIDAQIVAPIIEPMDLEEDEPIS